MKFLFVIGLIVVAQAAYDDLPPVSNPYEPPGTEPKDECTDIYEKIINEVRRDLGNGASQGSVVNAIGQRAQASLGRPHEVIMSKTAQIQMKTHYNGTICRRVGKDGFTYLVVPTPATQSYQGIEDYFVKFSDFVNAKNQDITQLPKFPSI